MKITEQGDQTFKRGDIIHTDHIVTEPICALIPVSSMITCDENGVCDDNSGNGDHHKIIKGCRVKYTIYEN